MLKHSPKTNISMLLSGAHAFFFLSSFLLEGPVLLSGMPVLFASYLVSLFVQRFSWTPCVGARDLRSGAPGRAPQGPPLSFAPLGLARILPRPLCFVPLCLCPLGGGRAVVTSSHPYRLAVSPARALAATTRRRAPSRRARARALIECTMF